MEAAALCLLLYSVLSCLDSGRAAVSVSVSPERLQFFKYESFSLSCEEEEEEEEERTEWRVMKRMLDGEVHACPSPCRISAGFPATDSGEYWCETGPGRRSDGVNITVTGGPVILESPARPVAEGDDVTLRCRSRAATSDPAARFYRDGVPVVAAVVRRVSASSAGLYRCSVPGGGDSPESRLAVRAPPAGRELPVPPPPPPLLLSPLLRHLVVGAPYLLCTILLGLVCRDRKRGLQDNEAGRPSDDVIMQLAA